MSAVDIIVPCYRYGRYLRECVRSVLVQSIREVRVLILNDASPDETDKIANELVREDSRVTYIRHTVNQGHIDSYNEGISWAVSDYLLVLSADDYLLPGALERAIKIMDAHPQVALAFGNAIEMDEQGKKRTTSCIECSGEDKILCGEEFIHLSGPRNIVPTPTAIVRTCLQKQVGGYRKELPHAGDMELWFRLAAHAQVAFIKSPQAVYRRHSSNMSLSYSGQRYLPDVQQRRAALVSFFESCSSLLAEPERLRRTLFYALAGDALGLANHAFNDGDADVSALLAAYAVETCPKIMRSSGWAKLSCKKMLGVRNWQKLRSHMRSAATTLQGKASRSLWSNKSKNAQDCPDPALLSTPE
jgi:hypothetical protein